MKANGYMLSPKSKQYHALDSLVYEYSNSGGMKDNIKVEINYMLRCHVLETEQRDFESSWEAAGVSVLSVAPIEIFASKIVALINPTAPRDLYDIYNLVKSGLIDESEEPLLRKCVVFYSAIGAESPPVEFQFNTIDHVTQNRIKIAPYPVLRNKDKFDLKTAQQQVKAWLEPLQKLEDNEQEFLNASRNKTYQPELLFESTEIVERIRNHPMALWKCSQK
jgi:hypothetical protein